MTHKEVRAMFPIGSTVKRGGREGVVRSYCNDSDRIQVQFHNQQTYAPKVVHVESLKMISRGNGIMRMLPLVDPDPIAV